MKKTVIVAAGLLLLIAFTPNAKAQEWSTGLDIYSSYIWRGAKFGSGPAFQPTVEYSTGGFAIGAWGSISASSDESLEMDLYASYGVGGFSIALTDYYFGGDWTEYSSMHYLEPAVSYEVGGFSILAAYMFLPEVEASEDMAGTSFGEEGDMYFEAGYAFDAVSFTLGAGDGQYTADGKFNVCNIGIGTSKEVKFTESFTLPMSGAVILNPSTGGFFITVGLSL